MTSQHMSLLSLCRPVSFRAVYITEDKIYSFTTATSILYPARANYLTISHCATWQPGPRFTKWSYHYDNLNFRILYNTDLRLSRDIDHAPEDMKKRWQLKNWSCTNLLYNLSNPCRIYAGCGFESQFRPIITIGVTGPCTPILEDLTAVVNRYK